MPSVYSPQLLYINPSKGKKNKFYPPLAGLLLDDEEPELLLPEDEGELPLFEDGE